MKGGDLQHVSAFRTLGTVCVSVSVAQRGPIPSGAYGGDEPNTER